MPTLPPETLSMVTRDGVRLDADVYRPALPGSYPVLLQRQAYGRRIACAICYAHPSWYAAQGYIVVVQDVRGRGTSEGEFRPGEHEAADGAEAIEWAARLEGSTGDVGLFGFSYQAYNQFLAASGDCPSLKTMIPAMGPWSVSDSWMFENGALRLKQAVGWGVQITAEAARRAGDAGAYAALAAAGLPVGGEVPARPDVLMRHAHLSHFADWIEKRAGDPFWATISPSAMADRIAARQIPTLMIGGWFDTHFAGILAASRALAGPRMRLLVGPWMHFPWTRKAGAVDFGPDAEFDVDRLQVRWFDRWLKGIENGADDQPAIRLFDMGALAWTNLAEWVAPTHALHLAGNGRASIRPDDGALLAGGAPEGAECFVHDPWRPAPAVGGSHGTPPGPVDRAATDLRGDILTFSTGKFEAPMRFAGLVEVQLAVSADQPSFDLSCILSRVSVTGQAIQIAGGYTLVPVGEGERLVRIPLQATCVTLKAGERLRLSIAGAAFPAFPVNPGTGKDPAAATGAEALVTTITVRCGGPDGSLLLMPEPESAG